MSSASGSRPVGRPARPSPETLRKGLYYLDLAKFGVTAEQIALREGVARSDVYRSMDIARPYADAGPEAPAANPAPQPALVAKKMGEGALLRRAWIAMHVNGRLRKVGGATRYFWLEVVMAVREEGDGRCLRFAECGYDSAADFATAFEGNEEGLALLIRRRVLEELEDGAGIALPRGLGLTPREKLGGDSIPGRRPGDSRQSAMVYPFPGGRSESEETPIYSDSESEETPIYSDSESEKTPIYSDSESEKTPIYSDSDRLAHAAAAAAKSKKNQSLSSSSSTVSRAGRESEEIRISSDSESEEITRCESEEITLASRAAGLVALARMDREPNAEDLGVVRGWQDAGYATDMTDAVIETGLKRRNGKPPSSLRYFDKAMKEAHEARLLRSADPPSSTAPPAPAAPVASPPMSEADKAAAEAWKQLQRRGHSLRNWWVRHKTGECPPLPETIREHYTAGRRVPADRWLVVMEYARDTDEPCLELPGFDPYVADPAAFEDQMLKCEEAMTTPSAAEERAVG